MDLETARWLTSPAAVEFLALAAAEPDPGSLGFATRLRRRLDAGHAAAVSSQEGLRRRARAKFGEAAATLFWTPDALEQATRPAVSRWRAERFRAAGAGRVVDLGCGVGADSREFLAAGLEVVAVELDAVTAEFARANLPGVEVRSGDAVAAWRELADAESGVFCDPARRTARGRSWKLDDLSPPWEFTLGLLAGARPACVKLGPGLSPEQAPGGVEASWVSESGDLVEAALWAGAGAVPGLGALLLPQGYAIAGEPRPEVAVGDLGRYVLEPDPAVTRANATGTLARRVGAHWLAEQIAYLTCDDDPRSPFATTFEVLEVLPYRTADLSAWVRANRVGTLEIKRRGVGFDPAALRRELRPSGPNAATLLVTPTNRGTVTLVVRRTEA